MASSDPLLLLPPASAVGSRWVEEVVVFSDQLWVASSPWAISHPLEVACSLGVLAAPIGGSWTMGVEPLT